MSHRSTLDPEGRFEVQLEPGLSTWLEPAGTVPDSNLALYTKLSVRAGDNCWSYDLATAHSCYARPSRSTPMATSDPSRCPPAGASCPRRDFRGAGTIWAELDLEAGETRVLDLR